MNEPPSQATPAGVLARTPARCSARRDFIWMALSLLGLLGLLFWKALLPRYTVFSNDGPLGAVFAESVDLAGSFFGVWQNLNWLGGPAPNALPDLTQMLGLICGPLLFTKLFAPFAAFFVGMSAWVCFRAWRFSPGVCLISGLAVGLNSDFLATACWGVAAQPLSFGLDFLALAALADESGPRRWLRVILAGFAVGLTIMEAFDIGAMFSLFVGAYAFYQGLTAEGPAGRRITRSAGRLALVALCAAWVAAAALTTLVQTQIKDIAGMKQDAATKAARWAEATQWSLPKQESFAVAIPGIFGFRMDTPKDMAVAGDQFPDGAYWGMVGSDAAWDAWFAGGKQGPPPQALARFNGGGIYAGVLVVLAALYALFQFFRGADSVFTPRERQMVGFWLGAAVLALLLSWGRFAPFYQVLYALPYASTFRNPAKFIHVTEWALLILSAYGLHGLSRSWQRGAGAASDSLTAQFQKWRAESPPAERAWVTGSLIATVAALAALCCYAHSKDRVAAYIQEVGFDPEAAKLMAGASVRQVVWFFLFLGLGVATFAVVLTGFFNGKRAWLAPVLLGTLLVADLVPMDMPYIVVWDYVQKYATNPIIDLLREPKTHPYEQRVAMLPFPAYDRETAQFQQLYGIEWKQHHWQYYGIQSLDIIMNPRAPEAYVAFETAMLPTDTNSTFRIARRWQLTNTRYLLGGARLATLMNEQLDPGKQRFHVVTNFAIEAKPGVGVYTKLEELTAEPTPQGPLALIEFSGALPRAGLYSQWLVNTNDAQTLGLLGSAAFDPGRTVMVSTPIEAPNPADAAKGNGKATIVSYAPKHIEIKASAPAPSVLLLNDKHDPNWSVLVDGRPAPLLRCNFLMRGVRVPAGEHTVVFNFAPPFRVFYVSLAAVLLGLVLTAFLGWSKAREK